MSLLYATNGMTLSIGGVKAFNGTDFVASDFTAGSPTWTLVGGVTNMGTIGDSAELITSNVINEGRTRKLKGTLNAGSAQVICNLDYADAGQIAVRAAAKARNTYAIKIEFNDKPATGASPKNSIRYFTALVMSAVEQFNEANNVMELHVTLEIDSNIVEVPASAT